MHKLDISIHAPREGSDGYNGAVFEVNDISIHAPREGSDDRCDGRRNPLRSISIHAPREGSDAAPPGPAASRRYFYPRSPRGERPPPSRLPPSLPKYFYPRSPRGERPQDAGGRAAEARNFYPRSPRGERRRQGQRRPPAPPVISIHAPREGSDDGMVRIKFLQVLFLSTLPARGATEGRGDSDGQTNYFYPRSPRGERPTTAAGGREWPYFYPRSPRGERRARVTADLCSLAISIHAPREGSDLPPPAGKRHKPISIHAPREGSDAAA